MRVTSMDIGPAISSTYKSVFPGQERGLLAVVEHECVTPAVLATYAGETDEGSRCVCELSNLIRSITGKELPGDSDILHPRVKS